MPAIAPIVISDASSDFSGLSAGTSTQKTFVPSNALADVVSWYCAGEDSSVDAREKITISVRQPAKGSQVARVTAKVVVPVMDSSSPKVKVGEGIATLEFVIPKRMTGEERNRLRAYATYLLVGSGIRSTADAHGDQNDFLYEGITSLNAPY